MRYQRRTKELRLFRAYRGADFRFLNGRLPRVSSIPTHARAIQSLDTRGSMTRPLLPPSANLAHECRIAGSARKDFGCDQYFFPRISRQAAGPPGGPMSLPGLGSLRLLLCLAKPGASLAKGKTGDQVIPCDCMFINADMAGLGICRRGEELFLRGDVRRCRRRGKIVMCSLRRRPWVEGGGG